MADSETTVGRETVQLFELRQPFCANTYGVAPCTAAGSGDAKCYHTRATCGDPANYRIRPEAGLGDATLIAFEGDAVDTSLFTTSADVFMAFDLKIPNAPDGLIYEQGGASFGSYLGFDGGNIIFRVGGGASPAPSTCARVSASASSLAGRTVTILAGVDMSARTATLWVFDAALRTLEQLGTATAASSIGVWTGSGDGGIGYVNGASVAGENTAAFNGTISEARFYDSTSAPDMDVSFTLSLFFRRGDVAEREISGVPYARSTLRSVSTAPARINMAGTDTNAEGIGNRAVHSISIEDRKGADRRVDPYRADRSFDALTRGTEWQRWLARNPYYEGIEAVIHEGYAGQALADMKHRVGYVTEISGPDANDIVTIKAQDALSRLEDRKAMCPTASPGILRGALSASATSFEVTGAVLSDYESAGTVCIDRECMTYSSVALTGRGLLFSGVVRGTDNTAAATHNADATVQRCVRFTRALPGDALTELLETWGGISRTLLKEVQWTEEFRVYAPGLEVTRLIVAPTPVRQLVSELSEQMQFNVFWDERTGLVDAKVVRGITAPPPVWSQERDILPGSFTKWPMPKRRVSELWVYYGQRDPTAPDDELGNFDLYVAADPEKSSYEQHGAPSIKKVYAKWIDDRNIAAYFADRYIARFRDTPWGAKLRTDAKNRSLWLSDVVQLSTDDILDQHGQRDIRTWTIVSVKEVEPGHIVEYELHDTTVFGRVYFYMADGSPNYPGAASAGFTDAYYGDSDGLLSDGNPAATYA